MRVAVLAVLALAACADASGEWTVSGDTARARADISTMAFTQTLGETPRLLRDAPDAETLIIEYYGAQEDRLGNDETVLYYTATFPGDDVAAADFANLSHSEATALASTVETGSIDGAALMVKSCPFRSDVCAEATGIEPQ